MKTWEKMRMIVKSRIREQGIKQKFLADKCGYDEKTFSLLINGKKLVTDSDIESFCNGMNVLPNDIVNYSQKSTA